MTKNLELLGTQIKDLQERIAELQKRWTDGTVPGPPAGLVAELLNSLEELHVAEEELRVQNEELVEAQRTIEVERRRYADLFNFAPDAYVVTDSHGNIREANAAAVELFGLGAHLLKNKPLTSFFSKGGRSEFFQTLKTLEQAGPVRDWETMLHPRVVAAFPASITAAGVRDGEGRMTEFRWLIRDITQQRKNEAELARHREHLEDLVKEGTADLALANEKLRHEVEEHKQAREELQTARDELEERVRERTAELTRSNAELEQFAYVASHDLQEPLRMVASYVRLLEMNYREKLDQDAREFIEYAVDGAVRMQSLIRDLLAYSRVSSHGKTFAPVAVEKVLAEALGNLEIAITETASQVTHDPMPTVLCDRTQLVQLFQNLIGNAIKFRGQRPAEVHVSACPDGDRWLFAIHDNGIGIESRHFERIFHIFQRLHTRQEYPGTGIGLAIVKRIVERHGGTVWLESAPGRGTTFYFTIPAEATGAEDERASTNEHE